MSLPYLTATNLPYGSRVLTIATVAYIAQTYRLDESGKLIERETELGAPNGAVLISQAKTGTATLQLALSSTAYPAVGAEFTADSVTYFLTAVGRPEEAAGFKTVEVSFREKV